MLNLYIFLKKKLMLDTTFFIKISGFRTVLFFIWLCSTLQLVHWIVHQWLHIGHTEVLLRETDIIEKLTWYKVWELHIRMLYVYWCLFARLRPGIHSWLKFYPFICVSISCVTINDLNFEKKMTKSSYRGNSLGEMTYQRPSLRAETNIWMDGLNPNYNTTCQNFDVSLRNCCWIASARYSLLSFATPCWFLPFPPDGTPLRRSSLNYSRHHFYSLIKELSLYSVLISFAHNVHNKMLWCVHRGH